MNERPTSGPLSDIARYARQDIMSLEPPILENYRDAPVYDHAVILSQVAIRPLALYALEQHLGISSGARGAGEPGGQRRRYSDRDLIALLWMRERIIAGESPDKASERLIRAQRRRNSGALWMSGQLGNDPITGVPTGQIAQHPGYPQGRFSSTDTGTLTFGEYPSGQFTPPAARQSGISGALGGASYTTGAMSSAGAIPGEYPSGSWGNPPETPPPLSRSLNPSRPFHPSRPLPGNPAHTLSGPQAGGASGRLGAVYSAPTAPAAITRPTNGFDPVRDQFSAKELRWQVSPLMNTFSRFDTRGANRLIQQALEQFGVEVVCLGLVQPTIARVSDLWSKSELTIPEERFALNYLRGFLTSVFHSTIEPDDAPLVVVGCAHHDERDLPALLLAVFLRRSGVRVIYLGADAGAADLAHQHWATPPSLICLTMTSPQRIRSVNHLARQLRGLPTPHPDLCFAGPIFTRNSDLQRKVNAKFLGDDPAVATTTARRLLGIVF
jgi:methanogenic corrinoid protein MtbC1